MDKGLEPLVYPPSGGLGANPVIGEKVFDNGRVVGYNTWSLRGGLDRGNAGAGLGTGEGRTMGP